jgi:N-acetylated-alpha-linked acidic dipeptidase
MQPTLIFKLQAASADLLDAKTILQDELGISMPLHLPIYNAVSALSRNATLLLTDSHAPAHSIAWIDTSLLVMNTVQGWIEA